MKLFGHSKKIYPSKHNKPIRIGKSFGKKAVFAGDVPQSGGEFNKEWDQVVKIVHGRGFQIKNCLMLGVAGGTGVKALQKYYPIIEILGIEIDPVILQVSLDNNLFSTNQRTEIKVADAINWVKKDKKKYDLVIVDVYLGDQNVAAVRGKPFLEQTKALLKAKGIILYSCHYDKNREGEYHRFQKTLDSIFSSAEVVFEFPKNKVLLISN